MSKEFLDQVRGAALTALWSKGVRLAQGHTVHLEEASESEVVFRVRNGGGPVPALVVLYPQEGDYTCDCDTDHSPCEHVVAAAIYWSEQASAARAERPQPTTKTYAVAYRFCRADAQSLTLDRMLVAPDGSESALAEPLSRIVARRVPPLLVTQEDLDVERVLLPTGSGANRASRSRGLSAEGYARVLGGLTSSRHVTLDGQPVEIDLTPILPTAVVRDVVLQEGKKKTEQLELRIEGPPDVTIVDRGVALIGSTLRPLGATTVAGPRWERLPLVKTVLPEDVAELVTSVLPQLERDLPVEIRSRRLPSRGSEEEPRIHFDLSPQGHTLSVLPTLVYGDPVKIRIDIDKVVHVGGDIPRRLPNRERELVRQLKDELSLVPGRSSHFDGADAARFAERVQKFQSARTATLSQKVITASQLHPHLELTGRRLEITFQTEGDTPREAAPEAVFQAFRDGLPMVPLLDGGWAPLPVDFLSRYGDKIEELLARRNSKNELPVYAVSDISKLCTDLALPEPRELDVLRTLAEHFEQIPERTVPKSVPVELRPYQQQGVNWLGFLQDHGLGAVLADDMGLGKTLQTLCVARGRMLVICPKSVVFNWARETARFRPDLSVNIYHGPRRALAPADITLTTFAVLRMDEAKLREEPWDMIVLDEAQAIKNPESQLARAAFVVTDALPEGALRVALSGTPIENRLDELWSIFRFTHPGLLGARREFARRYAEPIQFGEAEARERLRQIVKPFLLRRMKREVLTDLPPRTDVVLTVELEQDERDLYDAILAAKRKEVVESLESGGNVLAALEALLRLRQAVCHPSLVPGQSRDRSSKVEALLEALEEASAGGHKCIVFSQWTSLLDLVEPELAKKSIGFVRLDGKTEDRQAVVEKFQDEAGPPVFLSSLKAGGTGLNLTAADYVFLLDPWWNPAAEDQAADRAHRIGQNRPVTVYRLIAKDTIEEGMMALQAKKRELSTAILDGGGAEGGLSRDDLLALLR